MSDSTCTCGEYDRGYDDGYQAAAADEQAVDARNRQRLDELRDDLLEHCRTWRAITEVTSRPSVVVSAGDDLYRAAIALANHCAPRNEGDG